MTNDPDELAIENSVLVLIDHQPAVALNVHSSDLGLLVNNVAALNWMALTREWAPYWASEYMQHFQTLLRSSDLAVVDSTRAVFTRHSDNRGTVTRTKLPSGESDFRLSGPG